MCAAGPADAQKAAKQAIYSLHRGDFDRAAQQHHTVGTSDHSMYCCEVKADAAAPAAVHTWQIRGLFTAPQVMPTVSTGITRIGSCIQTNSCTQHTQGLMWPRRKYSQLLLVLPSTCAHMPCCVSMVCRAGWQGVAANCPARAYPEAGQLRGCNGGGG